MLARTEGPQECMVGMGWGDFSSGWIAQHHKAGFIARLTGHQKIAGCRSLKLVVVARPGGDAMDVGSELRGRARVSTPIGDGSVPLVLIAPLHHQRACRSI
jgi:hypothetical protein